MSWAMAEVQLGPPIFLSQLCLFLLLGCWPKPKHAFSGTLFPLCSLAFLPAIWLSDHVADFYVVLNVTAWLFFSLGSCWDLQCDCPGMFSFLSLIKLPPSFHLSLFLHILLFYLILLRMRLWTPQGAFQSPISSGDHEGTSSNIVTLSLWPVCAPYTVLLVPVMHVCFSVLHRFSRGRTDLAHFQRYGLWPFYAIQGVSKGHRNSLANFIFSHFGKYIRT